MKDGRKVTEGCGCRELEAMTSGGGGKETLKLGQVPRASFAPAATLRASFGLGELALVVSRISAPFPRLRSRPHPVQGTAMGNDVILHTLHQLTILRISW